MCDEFRWAGVDLGRESNQVCLLDSDGNRLGERAVRLTSGDLSQFVAWFLEHSGGQPCNVHVALERPHGALVEVLLRHEFVVYSINPKQLDRFRDRHTIAGAKDDRRDDTSPPVVAATEDRP